MSSYEKFQKRRVLSSYFSVIISVFLVLFLVGSLLFFVINFTKISNEFKENIPMTVFLKNEATDSIINTFETELKNAKYIKDFAYVSKDEAAKNNPEIVGEDFMEFIGINPLQNSFDIHLKGDYLNQKSITSIESNFKQNPYISEVIYDKNLVEMANENINKISFWMLVLSGVFSVIAFLLINSSIRLSIYANRFIIKTMQLVGATKSFIRKPFIIRSIKLGLVGSVLAIVAVLFLIFYMDEKFPTLGLGTDYQSIALVIGSILLIGLFISWISTFFATQKYLNLKTDELY